MAGGVRLFGHPVHAMLSHFPLALFGTSPLWEAIGLATGQAIWWQLAFWNVALGVAAAVPTAAAGLVDYASLGANNPAERTATTHMLVMLGVVTCFGCSLIWLRPSAVPTGAAALLAAACDGLGLLGLAWGGWLGGELVFKHGVGVKGGG
jgi:uncharacterized membrane protein